MMATIANWAIVPPKLIPGVSRKAGVNSGDSAMPANSTMPNTHFWALVSPSHQSIVLAQRVLGPVELVILAPSRGSRPICRWV